MHILFITPEYEGINSTAGGLAQYVNKTSQYLIAQKHDVTVFTYGNKFKKFKKNNIHFYTIPAIKFYSFFGKIPYFHDIWVVIGSLYFSLSARFASELINRNRKLNLIQSSTWGVGGAFINNKKFVHVCRISSFTPALSKVDRKGESFSVRIIGWLEKKSVKNAYTVLSPSEFMKKLYKRVTGIESIVVRTPLPDFKNTNVNPTFYNKHLKDKKYFLYFGRLARHKGVDLIAKAMPSILAKNSNVYFVFIGSDTNYEGSMSMSEYILSLNKDFLKNVIIYEPLSKKDLISIIKNAYFVLMPSRMDNYPNAALESLYYHTPIITTANSSVDEIVTNGHNGFVANRPYSQTLNKLINKALKLNFEEYTKIKVNAKKYIKEVSKEDRIKDLITVYENTINIWQNN